jgi:hypothetical protein
LFIVHVLSFWHRHGRVSNALQIAPKHGAFLERPNDVRRRQWTSAENRAFEEWITNNPKPNGYDKSAFADSQCSLSIPQLQNKINNWRNARNIQNKPIGTSGQKERTSSICREQSQQEINNNALGNDLENIICEYSLLLSKSYC